MLCCQTTYFFMKLVKYSHREFNAQNAKLSQYVQQQISNATGCLPPCNYKEYILSQPTKTSYKGFGKLGLTLWGTSPYNKVETEELIYPQSSLVAEFGGILGLFLGFSFMTIWQWIDYAIAWFLIPKEKLERVML